MAHKKDFMKKLDRIADNLLAWYGTQKLLTRSMYLGFFLIGFLFTLCMSHFVSVSARSVVKQPALVTKKTRKKEQQLNDISALLRQFSEKMTFADNS